jgi:cathepsin L
MTPVKDQGQCGSCWAFAAIGVIEAGIKMKNGTVCDFSEQEIVDCCSSTLSKNVCSVGSGCNGGNSEQALTYVSKSGIAPEIVYPYTAVTGKTCKNTTNTTLRHKVVNASYPVTYVTAGSAIALQTALNTRPIAIYVDATYWSPYVSGIFTGCSSHISLNHAVVAVGYDAVGNWKVRNSWSATWGEAGYIRLAAGNSCGILSDPFYTLVI